MVGLHDVRIKLRKLLFIVSIWAGEVKKTEKYNASIFVLNHIITVGYITKNKKYQIVQRLKKLIKMQQNYD